MFSDGHPSPPTTCCFRSGGVRRAGRVRAADSLQVGGRKLDVNRAGRAHDRDHVSDAVRARRRASSTTCRFCRVTSSGGRCKAAPSPARGACRRRRRSWPASGPFVLAEYAPGQRLVFASNPHYWRKAEDGTPLPVPRSRRRRHRVRSECRAAAVWKPGQLDCDEREISFDSYAMVKRAADRGAREAVRPGDRRRRPTASGST